MPNSYPLPVAQRPEIERIQALYRNRYGVTLSCDEAKRLLEGVAQFIYLTEFNDVDQAISEVKDANGAGKRLGGRKDDPDDALRSLREEVE
jgi:hypothetical protein